MNRIVYFMFTFFLTSSLLGFSPCRDKFPPIIKPPGGRRARSPDEAQKARAKQERIKTREAKSNYDTREVLSRTKADAVSKSASPNKDFVLETVQPLVDGKKGTLNVQLDGKTSKGGCNSYTAGASYTFLPESDNYSFTGNAFYNTCPKEKKKNKTLGFNFNSSYVSVSGNSVEGNTSNVTDISISGAMPYVPAITPSVGGYRVKSKDGKTIFHGSKTGLNINIAGPVAINGIRQKDKVNGTSYVIVGSTTLATKAETDTLTNSGKKGKTKKAFTPKSVKAERFSSAPIQTILILDEEVEVKKEEAEVVEVTLKSVSVGST